MGLCVETGELRRPHSKPDVDFGKFTVQSADVPLGTLRKRGSKTSGQNKDRRKSVRLTPITETMEEAIDRERSSVSSKFEGSLTSCKSEFGTDSLTLSLSRDNSFERSDTPVNRKSYTKLLIDATEPIEDELERICEETGNSSVRQELLNVLTDLPPRPKCRRKVLPPTLTEEDAEKMRAKKLLKLRKRIESRLQSQSLSTSPTKMSPSLTVPSRVESVSPLKDIKTRYSRLSNISLNSDIRPKSAGSDVTVIGLADLSSLNSASVPDLPSIMNKLSRDGELKISRNDRLELEDNGALSTPRNVPDPPLTLQGWDKKCLTGSDMSSFYNMWERDRSKRPFGKKTKKPAPIRRDCMCSIKKAASKLGHDKNKCLPPIPPTQG